MLGKLTAKLSFCFAAFFLFCGFSFVYGGVAKGDIGVGVNYPGAGVRYFLSDKISLELKGQYEKDIILGGLRGYWYFSPVKNILPFAGLEADYVSFKGESGSGTGIAGEIFAGIEYFFTRSFSAQLDLGPAYISLDAAAESVSGLEYVVNFGINYYFGKKK